MEEFTQGTIIESIRSEKYKGIRCRGVVISARCDLAQRKIKLFHYLSALEMDDWIYEVLFDCILSDVMKQTRTNIDKFLKEKGLNTEVFLGFNKQARDTVLEDHVKKKREVAKIQELLERWNELQLLDNNNVSRERKKDFLRHESKICKPKIISLYNSNFPKYVFIPQKAYSDSNSSVLGMVVDLQDIHQISINHVKPLQEDKYDFQTILDQEERKRLNDIFFFENTDDFVLASGVIKSPWMEHLMQSFSFSFIRIGLDNASEDEVNDFFDKWLDSM